MQRLTSEFGYQLYTLKYGATSIGAEEPYYVKVLSFYETLDGSVFSTFNRQILLIKVGVENRLWGNVHEVYI